CPSDDIKDIQNASQCPDATLTSRTWHIQQNINNNFDVETIRGAGVIGLHPQIHPGQDIFEYQSCSQQTNPFNGKMWGSFQFKINDTNEIIDFTINPFYFNTKNTHWI